jgi:hypothetical protein
MGAQKSTMENLKKLSVEIIESDLDPFLDYAEIPLDEFTGDYVLKEIPIVKTLLAITKTGIKIKEMFFIKKFIVFLQKFRSGDLETENLKEFKNNLEKDEKYRNKVLEQILILIDKLDSVNKSKILAELFRSYIEKRFDWERFIAMTKCLDDLQEITYPLLKTLSQTENFHISGGFQTNEIIKKLKIDMGYLNDAKTLLISAGIARQDGYLFQVTNLGKDLYKFGISKI